MQKRKEDILQKLEIIAGQLADIKDDKKNDLIEKQNRLKNDLSGIKSDEEHYKSVLLNRIDRNLENIAKKMEIDFILNIGEGLLYSKKEYDITEEVLRELVKEKERSVPVSR